MTTLAYPIPESAVQSPSAELSDELTTALAAERWWAIMEVSLPIDEEPEYGNFTSPDWWGTIVEGNTSCPTSLAFSDESEMTESPHLGFSDKRLNTKELWGQKKTQSAPMLSNSQKEAPSPASANKRDHTTSPGFNNESEKTESLCSSSSDATLKITEQQRKWRQKKPQGPPVLARSEKAEGRDSMKTTKQVRQECRQKKPQGPPVLGRSENAEDRDSMKTTKKVRQECKHKKPQGLPVLVGSGKAECGNTLKTTKKVRQKEPQVAPVPAESPQGPPVPGNTPRGHPVANESQQRGKLRIPEHLRQHLLKAAKEFETPVPARSQKRAPAPTKSLQREPVPASQLQKLQTQEPLRQELQQEKPQASSEKGAPMAQKTPEKKRLKIPERMRQELLQVSRRASSEKEAPVLIKAEERQKPKMPELLKKKLLQQKPPASPAQGKPLSSKCQEVAPLLGRNPGFSGASHGAGELASSPLPTGHLKEESVPTRTVKAGKRRLIT